MRSPAGAPYQLLPRLADAEYAALKADIARHGVLVPVEVDEADLVLDGHHRLAAAEELGLAAVPRIVRPGLSEAEKHEHVLRLNLLRRQLGPVAWAGAFRQFAAVRGIDDRVGGAGGKPARNADSLTALASELGVSARTARRRLRLATTLARHPDLAAAVDRGDLAAARARETARIRDRRADLQARPAVPLPPDCDLRAGDFRTVLADLPAGSVDLVFTDPPYGGDAVPHYRDLGAFAARVLRPGGLLIAYAGQAHVPEVLAALAEHCVYLWTCAIVYEGGHAALAWRHLRIGWKPLLLFARPPVTSGPWFSDTVASTGAEAGKDLHPWQQSPEPARYYITRLTRPGDLVCDPFAGSGTTAATALALGRRFVGAELDPETYAVARGRIAAAQQAAPDSEDDADALAEDVDNG
jgi:site-specific DNA-methyltransferase (adenine-specific)